jgi:hypothetical protein
MMKRAKVTAKAARAEEKVKKDKMLAEGLYPHTWIKRAVKEKVE